MTETILVVEDNPITRKLVDITLSTEGYRVVLAENARDALDRLDHCVPDLVLQDVALGDGFDGLELVQRIRACVPNDTPIVAFTGNTNEGPLRTAGFTDILIKPVEPERLLEAVSHHLGHSPKSPVAREPSRDHAWAALTSLLSQLTELTGTRTSEREIVSQVMASFLHASGCSSGFAYTLSGQDLDVCAQLGFTKRVGHELAIAFSAHPRVEEAFSLGRPVVIRPGTSLDDALLAASGAQTIVVIPLGDGDGRVGLLVLASVNTELAHEWLELAAALAAPVTQAIRLAAMVAHLTASEHKFRGISEATLDGLLVTDQSGHVTYANHAAERMFGHTANELHYRPVSTLLPHLREGGNHGHLVVAGSPIPIETTMRSFEDPPGQLSWIYVVRDRSQQAVLDDLYDRANRDALTGLFNRSRFHEELVGRLAASRRFQTPGTVLAIDLDHFKQINDTHGHAAGDAVLAAVGKVLRANIRICDVAARLGGDEFAILLDRTTLDGAHACAEKLLQRMRAARIPFGDVDLSVGVSIGIAEFPDRETTAAEVLMVADAALYRSKRAGRGGVCAIPEVQP